MHIMSQDGRSVGEYQLLTVRKLTGKRFGIHGYCHTGNLDKMLTDPSIAEYNSEDRAQRELGRCSPPWSEGTGHTG